MYDSIDRFLRTVLLFSTVCLVLIIALLKLSAPILLAVICTVIISDLIAMALCYKAYHSGTGHLRDIARMPMDVPHKVEFYANIDNNPVIALRAYSTLHGHRSITPRRSIKIYRGELPKQKEGKPRVEFVFLSSDETELKLNQWELPEGWKIL